MVLSVFTVTHKSTSPQSCWDKIDKIVTTFNFFGTIQLIYNFIESNYTRHATLELVANSANIKIHIKYTLVLPC